AGEIAVVWAFGPWNGEEPSLTPIEGSFLFDADLGTIKGIGGAMHAEGSFNGPLEYIRTSGKTQTEGFHLSTGGAKFPLFVYYEAIVDGTNGDTTLETVEGTLGQSKISARGAIVGVEGVKGRRITLDTTTHGGRLEDFVKLTTRVPSSPMTGQVNVRATLDIPPGEAEVIERMDLEGTFDVQSARFTSPAIQNRVDELSRRGRGRPADQTIDDVASNLRGAFRLRNAHMTVRSLSFRVQGAEVRLAGGYDINSERLDFRGTLRLQAKASQTQTGWKSLVLRVFDPMLDDKGAGTLLPITVTGTRDQPKFGADLKKAILK
ncbi:MAG: AsmA-like C-terminal region-containing protein, partial [Vicinamibacterales bacterium]